MLHKYLIMTKQIKKFLFSKYEIVKVVEQNKGIETMMTLLITVTFGKYIIPEKTI